ncbi:hypothetical protein GCM10010198_69670 [Nocardia seriolae]|nr:hypothetical protein NSERUTF1_4725 [Nocardia seriolae]BEK89271.1 hypothetical protein NSERKGN1266_52220 [Nocardia seriolae]BEK95105.1 hypothetical protein NSER024013_30110 [Nocardia seriolae]GEM26610.1 hypothetical protein NS2_48490 [Nocardia seriolae NBRC 15557]
MSDDRLPWPTEPDAARRAAAVARMREMVATGEIDLTLLERPSAESSRAGADEFHDHR